MIGKGRVIGVDIGSSKIRVVELGKVGDRVTINYYNEIEAPIAPYGEREEFLKKEGKTFFKHVHSKKVFASLPGRGILIRMLQVPNVPSKKLQDILKYEVQQQIPFPLEVIMWTYQILSQNPQNLNILLGAAKKDLVNNYISSISPFNLNVEFLDTDFFAL